MVTNHILQSTVFAAIAGLLTLLLRNNHARTRYWIWLTASLKFLIPFSIFVELGHRLSYSSAPAISHPQLAYVMDEISRPFATSSAPIPIAATTLPIFPAIWLAGSATLLIFWLIRWFRVAAILRAPGAQLEPGVFGIFRPVLYLPPGIAAHLDEAQLTAIVAHEHCHIRNRDNLTAALHSLVEAIFWFHPLTWWIGARLVEERERACDEEVVRLGSDPEVYAESILKVCKLYLASPLACVPGISGSDLKKRIEAIMINRTLRSLNPAKKLALAVACLAALAAPVFIGIVNPSSVHGQPRKQVTVQPPQPGASVPAWPEPVVLAQTQVAPPPFPVPAPALAPLPEFDAASIRPSEPGIKNSSLRIEHGTFTGQGVSVKQLILYAYRLREFRLSGGPGWLDSDRYEILAKAASPVSDDEVLQMLRSLLASRFQLAVHHDAKELQIFELVIGKKGFKPLPPGTANGADHGAGTASGGGRGGGGALSAGVPGAEAGSSAVRRFSNSVGGEGMRNLANGLSGPLGAPVEDKTGLEGPVEYKLVWNRDDNPDDITIASALNEQLGLTLRPKKGPVDILVIDRVTRTPTEN